MYYLFLTKKKDIEAYKAEFERVHESIECGKTPVFNELRSTRTQLFEAFPYQVLSGMLLVLGTTLLARMHLSELAKIAVVLVVNNMCGAIANYIFAVVKHRLRLRLCDRLGVARSERNIAVMESMEYQSV